MDFAEFSNKKLKMPMVRVGFSLYMFRGSERGYLGSIDILESAVPHLTSPMYGRDIQRHVRTEELCYPMERSARKIYT